MSRIAPVSLATLEATLDRMSDAEAVALVAKACEELRFVAPVNADTKRAFKLLAAGEEGGPELTDALEALRDALDDEYFELDAANDEEAASVFQRARAVNALVNGLKSLYADCIYEASLAVEEPRAMIRRVGLDVEPDERSE